jgi:hypothetical protein
VEFTGTSAPNDALAPEPRSKAVDKIGDLVLLDNAPIEACLRRGKRIGCANDKTDEIEPETRIERIGKCIQLFPEEPQNDACVADRPAGLDGKAAHGAVRAEEAGLESPPAFPPFAEATASLLRQLREHGLDILGAPDRLGETLLDPDDGKRPARRQRRFRLAEDPPQLQRHRLAETRREGEARPVGKVTDGLEPGARNRDAVVLIEFKCSNREGTNGEAFLARRHDGDAPMASQGAGGVRRPRDHRPNMKACPLQSLAEASAQLGLAAKQVIASGNVEQQPVRCIDHHDRREPVAILGDALEQSSIRDAIHLLDAKIRITRPGVGKRESRRKAKLPCVRTDRLQPRDIPDLLDQDKRRLLA